MNGSLFGSNGPQFTDVRQGQEGDCWLLASLAEVAARNSSYIRNMFSYVGTEMENGVSVGLYSVRFFDTSNVSRYVTVDTELPQGGGYYDQVFNGSLWVALAEKAYAQANAKGYVTTFHAGVDSYDALGNTGGIPSWALHTITGLSASNFAFSPSNIATAWNQGKFIVLGTGNPTSSYIVGGHAYAVVGYNASSSMPFEEFNPWGAGSTGYVWNNSSKYGLFWANASFISQNFTSLFHTGAGIETDGVGSGVLQVAAGASAAQHAIVNRTMPALTIATEELANESHHSAFDSWNTSHQLDHTDSLELNVPSTSAWEVAFNSLSEELFSQVA